MTIEERNQKLEELSNEDVKLIIEREYKYYGNYRNCWNNCFNNWYWNGKPGKYDN